MLMLNPVLRREMRTSLRTWKIYMSIALHIFIISAAAGIFLWVNINNSYYYGFNPQILVGLYIVMVSFQFMLVLITTPALTAGSISSEREKQTLDLLLITKMSPISIILGKLMSCLGIVILMIIGTLPVFAVIFYFGGISFFSLIGITLFLLSISCVIGSISILMSSIFKKTTAAMVIVYILIGFLCFGTFVIMMLYGMISYSITQKPPSMLMLEIVGGANPAIAFGSIIFKQMSTGNILNYMFGYAAQNMGLGEYVDFYIINFIYNVFITIICILLSAKLIKPSRRKK